MRAILIDPYDKTITVVDNGGSLQDIYKAIGCTDINAVECDETHHMYLDGEGLLKDPPLPMFQWQGFRQPFAGRGIIFCADEESNEAPATMSVGVAQAHVTFPALAIDKFTTHSYTRDDGTFVIENRPHFKRTGKE